MFKFFRKWSLVVSIVVGTVCYLAFSRIEWLVPVGDVAGPVLQDMLPVVLFALLYVTFCKIRVGDMKPVAWHFRLQLICVLMSAAFAGIACMADQPSTKLVLEGVFVCVACPTAAAAAVVTEKLGGSIASLTLFTIITNVVTALTIPVFFPLVERGTDISFISAMAAVLRNVTSVLVAPLLLAVVSRRLLPRFTRWLAGVKDLAFYMWCFNLTIVTGVTVRNILCSEVGGTTLALLILLPMPVAVLLFAIGKAVGRPYGDNISGGQAMGQKNTVVAIWLTITFLNPLAAVAPGAYVIWQNLINAWQIWYKEKYGRLKW